LKFCLFSYSIIFEGIQRSDRDNADEQSSRGSKSKKTELNAKEIQELFRNLWRQDAEILVALFPVLKALECPYPTDIFFVETLAVAPPKIRPCQFTGGLMTVHPQSTSVNYVVETISVMKLILRAIRGDESLEDMNMEAREAVKVAKGDSQQAKLLTVWKELQSNVDHVLDREINSGTGNKVCSNYSCLA
jgi:DNA-directed RNA polymerase I subunit RPA1